MLASTHQKGEIGKLKVMLRATELGWIVSVPSVDARYDLVVDNGKELLRVQVKYCSCSLTKDSVEVGLSAECRNSGYKKKYTSEEIDVVVAYLPATEKCYWLPIQQFQGGGTVTLRFTPTKNMQVKNVHLAKDFEW